MLCIRCGDSWMGLSGVSLCAGMAPPEPPSEEDAGIFGIPPELCCSAAVDFIESRHHSPTMPAAKMIAAPRASTKARRYFLPASTCRIRSWYSFPMSWFWFMASSLPLVFPVVPQPIRDQLACSGSRVLGPIRREKKKAATRNPACWTGRRPSRPGRWHWLEVSTHRYRFSVALLKSGPLQTVAGLPQALAGFPIEVPALCALDFARLRPVPLSGAHDLGAEH